MQRDYKAFLEDILDAISKIERYTKDLSFDDFKEDDVIIDATIRNLEIIGESTKNIPETVRKKYPDIEWKKMAGLRDILIHAYFGADIETVWDIIESKLTKLKNGISSIIEGKEELME